MPDQTTTPNARGPADTRSGLRRRVFPPIFVVVIVVAAFSYINLRSWHADFIDTEASRPAKEIKLRIDEHREFSIRTMTAFLHKMSHNEDLLGMYLRRDFESTRDLLVEMHDHILTELGIEHLYIHDTDGTNYLRAHKPLASGGPVDRWTFTESKATGRIVSGFESGKFGALTLRCVYPWEHDGEIIGYLEMGKELTSIATDLGEPMLGAIPKRRLDESSFRAMLARSGIEDHWDNNDQFVIPYCTSELLRETVGPLFERATSCALCNEGAEAVCGAGGECRYILENELATSEGTVRYELVEHEGGWSLISAVAFRDANDELAALLFASTDVSDIIGVARDLIRNQTASITGLVAIFALGCWILLGRLERTLDRRSEQLVAERERANDANRAKSDFIANMSHEIRTPLTSIIGFTEILQEGAPEDEREREGLLGNIRGNADHLITVVGDILDIAKLEAGKIEICSETVDTRRLVHEIASSMAPRCEANGLVFAARLLTPIPERVSTDPTRLKQILFNLLGNAIKFTESGEIQLEVACDPELERIEFRVTDTGIGMSPDQLERIRRFEPFTQADFTMARRFGGTGLGLSISNTFATLLGGSLDVESKQGRGSTFTVSVATGPVEGVALHQDDPMSAPFDSGPASETSRVAKPDALHGMRVLLVEDADDLQRLFGYHLTRAGADLIRARNGLEAIAALSEPSALETIDVVLMDMQMPECDGYEATKRLRAAGVSLPIVALTAHASKGDREKCLNSGCDEYLTKPIPRDRLIDICLRVSESRSSGRANAAA